MSGALFTSSLMCYHKHVIGHGYTRKGDHRVLFKDCGRTWRQGKRDTVNRLSDEQESALAKLIAQQLSIRQIRDLTGHATGTIMLRQAKPWPAQKLTHSGPGQCDHCGKKITKEREWDRPTKRTEHKFCTRECFNNYYRSRRSQERCWKCHQTRQKIDKYTVFSHGLCKKCYYLARKI